MKILHLFLHYIANRTPLNLDNFMLWPMRGAQRFRLRGPETELYDSAKITIVFIMIFWERAPHFPLNENVIRSVHLTA